MALDTKIFQNDVGVTFELEIRDEKNAICDVSNASVIQIKFKKPNGTSVTKTAGFTNTGTDGKIEYTTVANELNVIGEWEVQGFVTTPNFSLHSTVIKFRVFPHIQ